MKNLTLILHNAGNCILARGIVEDATVFEHVAFTDVNELAQYAHKVLLPNYTVRVSWTGKEHARG